MSNLRSHLTKSDFILILFLLFIGIGITVWIYYPKSTPASTVEVREDGKLILSLPLSENTKQTIRCTDGGSNQFLIQDGAVTMTDADCGDKTCVKTGSIKETGQSIVCLPLSTESSATAFMLSNTSPSLLENCTSTGFLIFVSA